MKTLLLNLGLVVLAAGTLNANVLTCSNNAIAAGMYSSIQAAHDAAAVGDTVYVMGSPTSYGDLTMKKRITLIGAGYAVTGTQNNWFSQVGTIYLDSVAFGTPISGAKIMGLYMTNGISQTGTGSINGIDIERCYISYSLYVYGSGWIIRNNVADNIYCNNHAYIYIQNNFLQDVEGSNQTTVIISNNDFVIYNGNAFSTVSNALVANNIFYYCSPLASITTSTFSNNITTNTTAQVLPSAGNTGSGNINNTPPGFVDATIPLSTVAQGSVWNYNWKLSSSSPAHNTGTDGTDLGVYGGSYPMPNVTGATRIPQMQLLNVSGVVPQGGNLNVNFKARKQN